MADSALLEHLPDDHFYVLVVDVYALALVHRLNLADQVVLNSARPLELQNLLGIQWAVRQPVARMNDVTLLHLQLAAVRYERRLAEHDLGELLLADPAIH